MMMQLDYNRIMERTDPMELDELTRRWRRRAGGRMTAQKRLVLQALLDIEGHPSVDEVFENARVSLPELSRTTVFRILQSLVASDLVRSVSHPGSEARYELKGTPHHHLICTGCHRVFDVEPEEFDAPPDVGSLPAFETSDERGGFESHDVVIHFRGLCVHCRSGRSA